ncbi:DNA-processing protein DprA [Virgibacillus ihumii]|uniref:DNA-processing protein DprA n=1 Tax=Virgibacillus ihumii TaxID=2686091 RepID=UPI00157D119B|nr:DNA-processing protein DprA [Virgibacillus ihumii]
MEAVRKRLIHITRCRGITRRSIRRFVRYDPTLQSIYKFSSTEINQFLAIPHKQASLLYSDLRNPSLIKQIIQDISSCRVITLVDEDYPVVLKTIKDAPLVLYAMGNTSLLDKHPLISVIGTRKPSREALSKTEAFVVPLIHSNWVIVSGMASGIDSMAHQQTLKYDGMTIAVLGGGFHHIYPKHNYHLFNQIAEHGLVLSEYPPDTPPKRYHFPERNRIISGLSFGTLVIEATERSGTLITVDQALDQGREVYAVPGNPFLAQTRGCHKMIQEGAKLVQHPMDIMEDWERMESNYKLLS